MWIGVGGRKVERGCWFLRTGQSCRRTIVLVDTISAGIHDPVMIDVVGINRKTGGGWICCRKRPAAQQRTDIVIDT